MFKLLKFALLCLVMFAFSGCGKIWQSVSYQSTPNLSAMTQFQLGVSGVSTEGIALAQDSHQNTFVLGWTQGVLGTQYGSHGAIDTYVYAYNS